MTAHLDILAQPEPLGRPLVVSVALHVCVLAGLFVQGMIANRPSELWGDPGSLGGGSVAITPVSQIPLPARGGPPNPLASDTESAVPPAPPAKKQARREPEPDPAAIAIKSRAGARQSSPVQKKAAASKLSVPETPNQLYSTTGRALSSPMVAQTGSGGTRMGAGGAFGDRFGYYRSLLEQRVARQWRTGDVDPRLETAPPVIVTFVIRRDGSASNIRLEQSSGNRALDYSAERAIREAGPFPPLPQGFDRDEARIEFWFELKR